VLTYAAAAARLVEMLVSMVTLNGCASTVAGCDVNLNEHQHTLLGPS
jgi:hypothetical protein